MQLSREGFELGALENSASLRPQVSPSWIGGYQISSIIKPEHGSVSHVRSASKAFVDRKRKLKSDWAAQSVQYAVPNDYDYIFASKCASGFVNKINSNLRLRRGKMWIWASSLGNVNVTLFCIINPLAQLTSGDDIMTWQFCWSLYEHAKSLQECSSIPLKRSKDRLQASHSLLWLFPSAILRKTCNPPTRTAPPTISEGQLCPVNVGIGLKDSLLAEC